MGQGPSVSAARRPQGKRKRHGKARATASSTRWTRRIPSPACLDSYQSAAARSSSTASSRNRIFTSCEVRRPGGPYGRPLFARATGGVRPRAAPVQLVCPRRVALPVMRRVQARDQLAEQRETLLLGQRENLGEEPTCGVGQGDSSSGPSRRQLSRPPVRGCEVASIEARGAVMRASCPEWAARLAHRACRLVANRPKPRTGRVDSTPCDERFSSLSPSR